MGAGMLACPAGLRANTTYTWSGGNSGTGYFDVGSNWAGSTAPPVNGPSDLVFGSVNLHSPNQPYTEFNYNLSSITFNSSALTYAIGTSFSNTINISSGGITDTALNNSESINVGLILGANQTWNVSNSSFSALSTVNLGAFNLTVNPSSSSAVANFSGTLSGSGATVINKTGAGSLVLTGSGSNIGELLDSSGNLQVSGGSLTLTSTSEPIGIAAGTLTVSNGASITGTGNATYVGNTAGLTGNLLITSGASLTSQYGVVGFNTGTVGVATVTGANSLWTMQSGLTIGGFSGTMGGSGTVIVSGSGAIVTPLTKFESSLSTLNVSGGTFTSGYLTSNGAGFGAILLTDPSGGTALNINGSSGTNTYSGSISGTGTLNKSGGSTQIFAGNLSCGTVLAQGGTLNLAISNSSSNSINSLQVTSGTTLMTSGSLTSNSVSFYGLYVSSTFNISGGAKFTSTSNSLVNAAN